MTQPATIQDRLKVFGLLKPVSSTLVEVVFRSVGTTTMGNFQTLLLMADSMTR